MISAFIPTEFYEFRPANINLSNLKTGAIDLTNINFETNSIQSLSCMHTVEHIGLGRYGDPLDPLGDVKAINELKRVCGLGGNLLLVVPVGKPRIQFNAHRIYDPNYIVSQFENFKLLDFSVVMDDGSYLTNAPVEISRNQSWACGCFWFVKERSS